MDRQQRSHTAVVGSLFIRASLLFVGWFAYACNSDQIAGPSADAPSPRSVISDGANNGGNAHFFFLPPIASQPRFTGVSDGSLAPHVTVCEWTGARCGNVIADFGTQGGTASQTVRYDATAQSYIVNWDTKTCLSGACTLDPAKTYRLRVFVGRAELGYADVKPVSSGSELKNASTGESVALVNGRTVPVKFRIEQGAVKVVTSETPATVDASGGAVSDASGIASLDIPAGALTGTTDISIAPAVSSPAGTIDGLAPVVQLGPDGTQFSQPVELTLPFDPSKLPAGVPASALAVYTSDGSGWREVPGSTVDEAGGTVSAPIMHFSVYSLFVRPNTVNGTSAPTTIDVGQTTTVAAQAFAYYVSNSTTCYYTYSSGGWTGHVITSYYCYSQSYAYYYYASNLAVSWASSFPQIASVPAGPTYTDANGVAISPNITGASAGTTAIIASSSGLSSSISITVAPATVVRTTADDGPGSLRRILANAPTGATITFAAALTDAASGGGSCSTTTAPGCVIKLTTPLTIAKDVTIQGPASNALLSVDGGHTAATTGTQVFIINSGTVAIRNLTITRGYAASQGGGVFVQSGIVTFDGCRITNSYASTSGGGLGQGGGLYNAGGTVTFAASTISNDTASAGGALYNYNSAALNVTAGTNILDSYASNIGGGIINFGTLRVTGSTIRGNAAVNQGGGIYNFALGQVVLTQSNIAQNSSPLGGGVYNYFNGTVTLVGSSIGQNLASTNGGGIYNDGSLTMDAASSLSSNRAANQGGGMFNGAGTTTINGSTLTGNRATTVNGGLGQGGAIYNSGGTVTLVGATASRDTADAGAALYNYNFGTLNVNAGSNVTDSYATNIGGGILNFGTVRINGSSVRGNAAVNQGGGIYNFAIAQLAITQSSITQNSAPLGGGVYNYINGVVTLTGTSISQNAASTNGAGIYNDGSLTMDAASSVSANRAANQGGGIFNGVGTATINGSALSGNRATGANGWLAQGGAVYNHSGTVTLVGATASRDTADAGGALYNYNFGTLNVTSGTNVLDSYATNVGGGIINFGTVRVTGSTLRGNTAANQGGAVYNFAVARVEVTQSNIVQNTAPLGGGVYNYLNGTVTLTGSSIAQNFASTNGGGMYNDGSVTMDAGSSFSSNRAANQGGGIFNGAGSVTINGSNINGNRATTANGGLGQGGAVYNHSGTVTLVGATASRDTADAGGALYNYNFGTLNVNSGTSVLDSYASNVGGGMINFGTLRVTSSIVRGNTSVNQGGGIYNFAVAQLVVTDSDVSSNSASTGGGLYNYSNGTVTLSGHPSVCGNSATTPPVNIANIGNLSGTNYDAVGSTTVCPTP